MKDIAEYLMINYYSKYSEDRPDIVPTFDQLVKGLDNSKDKLVVIRDEKIKGVSIFLTLSDETYLALESFDLSRLDILSMLVNEVGENVHFVLLCADGLTTILKGIKEVKKRVKPKTISWWDPEYKRLHKFKLGD